VKRHLTYSLVALAVLGLATVPVGTAVFVLGFGAGDSPCVMCWEQRIGMLIIALLGLFVLRYGPKPKYVGLSVLVASWGIFMGLRHTAMHAARDVGQGFSIEVFGAHTYAWALLIYWVCAVTMGLLLLMTDEEDWRVGIRGLEGLEKAAFWVFLVVAGANAVQAFASTGPPPFVGQSDPVRFSLNPTHWVWSTGEWSLSPVSLRGRWAVEKADVARANSDPDAGPLAGVTPLVVAERSQLTVPLRGTPTGLAYEEHTDQFALTTELGVHVLDGSLKRVVRHTVLDPGYSVDLGRLADVAFLDNRTIMTVAENKSYVILRENDRADPAKNYRYFLESRDQFDELSRSRLTTVRGRMMFVLSLAFDPSTQSIYTLTVPNGKVHRLVVSRFDRRDMTLSEEFSPVLKPGGTLSLKEGSRSLDDYYVSAATVANGFLYAVSAAHGTLLTIDLAAHAVVDAHTIPGLAQPVGLARRGDQLYILCRDSGVFVVPAPVPVPANNQQ
jgi:disulfide bond formation protein DsbB